MISKIALLAAGDLVFSLPVHMIRQVLDAPRIFPLPQLNPCFLGVLLYHDQPVPVLNPGQIWSETKDRRGPWPLTVLLQVKQGDVGFPIDRISHIVDEDRGSWFEPDVRENGHGDRAFLFEGIRYPLLHVDFPLQPDTPKT